MGAAAAAQRYALGADQIAREVEQIDESYGEVAGLIRTNGVTESMILDSEPEGLLDDLNVTNNLQRRKLKAECDGLREARESGMRISASDAQRSKFAPLVKDVTPWGLGPDDLAPWLEQQLTRSAGSKKIDWAPMHGALSGFDGIDLIARSCSESPQPPWVKPTHGNDGQLRRAGVTFGQIGHLRTVLNNYGIGFYALLHQSCDRHSPLMDYEWIEKVGEGGFGQVHKVRNRYRKGGAGASGDALVALKLIRVEDEKKMESGVKEMAHHQRAAASSEFVVEIFTWGQIGEEFLYVTMEFCAGGDINKLLTRHGMTDAALRVKLYLQVCKGIAAIHQANLIHMDMKPANVLLTEALDARIADLGLATYTEREGTVTQTHVGGTVGYQAPEIATRKFSSKADIFSVGVMFFEMAVGELPDITSKNMFGPLEARDDPETLDLLRCMLQLDATERPSAEECVRRIETWAAREARKLGADADAGSPPLNVGNEAVNGSGPNDLAVQPNPIDVQRDGAMEAAPLEETGVATTPASKPEPELPEPKPLPGGFVVGERVYFKGMSERIEDGSLLTHGAAGEVMGPPTPDLAGGGFPSLSVKFPGTLAATTCKLKMLSRTALPPLPGKYSVGEKVYFTGESQTWEDGDNLAHGQKGEIIGPADASTLERGEAVHVLFPGFRTGIDVPLAKLSPHPPEPVGESELSRLMIGGGRAGLLRSRSARDHADTSDY